MTRGWEVPLLWSLSSVISFLGILVIPKPGTISHNNLPLSAQLAFSAHLSDLQCLPLCYAVASGAAACGVDRSWPDTLAGSLVQDLGYHLMRPKSVTVKEGGPVCPCVLECLLPTFGLLPPCFWIIVPERVQ